MSPENHPPKPNSLPTNDDVSIIIMAQFVTHIQPTLVEASHHHIPHQHHHHNKGLHQHHHRESHHDLVKEAASNKAASGGAGGGSYMDSHGVSHAYQLKFVDSQGVRRDYHGYEMMDKSPMGEDQLQQQGRPVPPKYIDVQPVYPENKTVSKTNN